MTEKSFLALSGKEQKEFYDAKYGYFGKMTFVIAILVGFSSLSYYITDCQIIGTIQSQTIFSRFIILLPLTLYALMCPRFSDFRAKTILTLIFVQMVHYCTIWSIIYLPYQTYVCAGAAIIQISVFMTAISAPFSWAVAAQVLVIVNLLVTHPLIRYEQFDIILAMNAPLAIGLCVCHYWLTKTMYGRFVLQEKLREQTYVDQLTGLYNRHKLQNYVDESGRFLSQYKTPVSVLIMDLDFFKAINDTYGHDKGDIVLESVGALIKEQFTEDNSICLRWGGEEFVVILFGCGEAAAYEQADILRQKIEKQENGVCPVTVSMGVAQYQETDEGYKATIKAADAALYEAKHRGRNRAVAYSGL